MKKALILVIMLTSCNIVFSQTWREQTSGVTTQLTSVSAIDTTIAWICGYAGVVLRTTNGGNTWQNVSASPIPTTLDLHCIYTIDANIALVCGSNATATFVFKTINGGTNWTQVFTQPGGFINAIAMTSATIGFMYGDPVPAAGGRWSLWKTTNGGTTWDSTGLYLPQTGTEAGWNNSMVLEGTNIWFGTNNTKIYYSSNNGTSWSALVTPGQVNSYAIAIYPYYINSGITGGTAILRTTNGGINWSSVNPPLPGTANISGLILDIGCYAVRQSNIIYSSWAWDVSYTAPAGNYRHITFSYTKYAFYRSIYGVRTNGGITKRTFLVVGIQPISGEVPEKYSLLQNYPNPFNPTTKIKFSIPSSGFVKLTVYDNIGREVKVLVNENLNPGTFATEFDASSLSSSLYFYTLSAGSYMETRKMILIK